MRALFECGGECGGECWGDCWGECWGECAVDRTRACGGGRRAWRGGFTLIEMLAVLLILSILIGVLVTQFGSTEENVRAQLARARLQMLAATCSSFESDRGEAPPSSLPGGSAVQPNALNAGGEALVVALFSNGYEGGGGITEDLLVDSDGDQSKTKLTDFGTLALFEIRDPWDNPIAYFRADEYGRRDAYLTSDPATGEVLESFAVARKNAATGRYFESTGYQLMSAGPDGSFGTEDDITSFD